jgi:DNA-binding CsgD family transcriptional regulator
MPTQIVGRDRELDAVRAFVASIAEGPAALVLEGEPGVGKTTLWRAGIAAAADAGVLVLRSSPAEAEARLPYAVLGDLIEAVAAEATGGLPPPQRRALAAALLWEEVEGHPPGRRTVAVASLSVLRQLAGAGPVLVAVDDVNWADASSAAALAFAVRRLASEPVGLLLARRDADADLPLGLERAPPERAPGRVRIGPLPVGALHRLLQDRLGVALAAPLLRRLHQASGGNPFYALEIARDLERRGGWLGPGEPLPVPERLHALVRDRLAGLPEATRDALAVAAALSQPTTALVAAATGTRGTLQAAADAQVVELDGDRVRFTHPLLASAAYASAGAERRRSLHRRLAELVDDPGERARQLAVVTAGPDEDVARALEAAAARARRRGAPATAAELAAQAYRLTAVGHPERRLQRLLATAHDLFEAGDTRRARTLFEEAVGLAPPGPRRAETLRLLAQTLEFEGDYRAAFGPIRAAVAEAEEGSSVRCMAEQDLALTALYQLRPAGSRPAQTWPGDRVEVVSLAEWLGWQAVIEALLARPGAPDLARRAVELAEREAGWSAAFLPAVTPDFILGVLLLWADDLDAGRERFGRARARAVELGDEAALPQILRSWSYAEWLGGNWPEAAAMADEGLQAAVLTGQRPLQAMMLGTRALVAACLGQVDQARADARAGLALATETGWAFGGVPCLAALGLLELSLGNPAGTHHHLWRLVADAEAAGLREPTLTRFVIDEVEALIALGRIEEAEPLLERFERVARGLNRPSALAVAARCHGLIAAARNDHATAADAFERALAEHELARQPFELARTLLASGQARRRARQKRPAREALSAALATFEALGARRWADRARAELDRIGGRPPATGELTPGELRVARLVAEGQSNKQVAAALFISPQTVEGHLKRIYPKLGVRSRAELAHRFAAGQREATATGSAKSPGFRDS